MAKKKAPEKLDTQNLSRARTLDAREQQLIALAYDAAEQRMRDGTATSQEITHFLKMGSTKERRERILDEKRIELMTAKTEALQAAKRIESLYSEAIKAVRSYGSPATFGVNTDDPHD